MRRDLAPMFIAAAKMFYRSLDTIWFAVVSPFLLLGVYALVRHLRFGFTGGGSVGFFTFIAVGSAAFIAAHFNQDGTVGGAAGYRAQGVLKRIAVTPISPTSFIAAHVLVRLLVGLAQTIAILAAAVALGAHIHYTLNLIWILPLAALALLIGVSFGFAIAGIAHTPEGANQLNIALFTPVLLLDGFMYPLQGMPTALAHIAEYAVPFTAQIQAFREAVAGHLAGDFAGLLVISVGWLALAAVLAVKSYRLVETRA
jgi:ABC-2 type transport system permease protein